ncbi:MAG: hypothetical protein M1831_003147 [Alyxoria varia]|nr:MAG: hypothetical protein M1831_003147 [Alyxoria varia]
MLSSLPPIIPHDAHNLWSPAPSSIASRPPATPAGRATSRSEQQSRRAAERRDGGQIGQQKSALELVRADEELLSYRKANIRRFGAGWLRPPGVPKTYQAMIDEAVERAEQEALARREAAINEAQAAAEEEARQQMAMDVDGGGVITGDGMERDLDDEVPEANEDGDDEDEDEDEDEDDEEEGYSSDEAAQQQERDLDNSIPEAGSYQHTDTEVEDSTTSDEDERNSPRPTIPRPSPHANPFTSPAFNPATTAARLQREMYDRDNRRHSARADDNASCPNPSDSYRSQPYLSDSEESEPHSSLLAARRSQRVVQFANPQQPQQQLQQPQQPSEAQHLFTPENNLNVSTRASPGGLANARFAQPIRPAVSPENQMPATSVPQQQPQARRPPPPPQPQFRHPSGPQQLGFGNPGIARQAAVGGRGFAYGYGDAAADDADTSLLGSSGAGISGAGSSPLGVAGPSGPSAAAAGSRGDGGRAIGGRGRARGGRAVGRGRQG